MSDDDEQGSVAPSASNPALAAEARLADALAGLALKDDDGIMLQYDDLWKPQDLHGLPFGLPGMDLGSSGGARCCDANQLSEQKTVLMHLLKSMGSNIMEGKSVINLSLPVTIFEPRSFLHRMTDVWQFAPLFLTKAARVRNDPVERVKLVATFLIAGLHRGMKQQKPFNPILGETFQGRFPDGTTIACEQVSHHPPVTGFQVRGPGWHFYGHHEYVASFRPNGLVGGQLGPNTVEFDDDGTKVTFEMPHLAMSGMMFGERTITYSDTLTFEDKRNDVQIEIAMNPDQVKGLRAWVVSAKTPADTIRGVVRHRGEEICEVNGSWLKELVFGETSYWKMGSVQPLVPRLPPADTVLPSDARFRRDLVELAAGNVKGAEEQKKILEEAQRADRRLRTDGEKSRPPASSPSSSSSSARSR